MVLPQFIETIEQSGLSNWVRGDTFWFILSVHAVGMALLVGGSAIIDLRILGVARDLPIAPLKRLYGLIWTGFWIQVLSGVLLLIGYPTKSLTNIDFYVKLGLIALALIITQMLKSRIFGDSTLSDIEMMAKGKVLAGFSLLFWFGVVTSARLLAYTYTCVSYPC